VGTTEQKIVVGPLVTSVTPNNLVQGAANKSVTINGFGFAAGAAVTISGTGVTAGAITVVNSTQVNATMTVAATAAPGVRDVTVTMPGSVQATGVGALTITPAPTATAINPSHLERGQSNVPVAITGANIVSGATVAVSGTGVTVGTVTFNSATSLTAVMSVTTAADTTARDVIVHNPDGGTGTCKACLTITAAGGQQSHLDYTGLVPARLWDSRPGGLTVDGQFSGTGLVTAGSETALDVAGRGGVSTNASAATLNVTVANAQGPGFVTVWPCGQPRPLASNLNYQSGDTIPNLVVSAIGTSGRVCFFTSANVHLVVDVDGFYPAATTYAPIVPARLLDTRPGATTVDAQFAAGGLAAAGSTTQLTVTGRAGIPTNASAVVVNVTATQPQGAGYVTVWPCGQPQPNASNLNYQSGATIPNLVISGIGTGGTICLFTSAASHLVVDVDGYYPATTSFRGLTPARLLDTRPGATTIDGSSAGEGLRPAGSITELTVAGRGGVPADAAAVVVNVTATEAQGDGYVTVWPCGQAQPNASNLNFRAGATIPNLVIAPVGANGKICLYTRSATHLLADVTGTFPP
jgi:hypothetical protein